MVLRACRPISPNTSTARSEAPFITTACWVNPAGAAMKPPSRTMRATLSRSPAAAFSCATRLMKQSRAAATPSATDTSAPSLPA